MATTAQVDGYVTNKITDVNQISQDAVNSANEYLQDLRNSIPGRPPYLSLSPFPTDLEDIQVDAEAPVRPSIENLVDDATIPTISDIVLPETPTPEEPTAPDISDIAIPEKLSIEIIPFDLTFPTDTISDVDVTSFEYVEQEYVSPLRDLLRSTLTTQITEGSTGLDADVEEAIFRRGLERDEIILENDINRLKAEYASSGFTLPSGTLDAQIAARVEEHVMKYLDLSRDVLIKQAELAQENSHFVIDKGLVLEQLQTDHANRIADRALEAAKSAVNLGIALFNVQLERFKSNLEAYRIGAQAFGERIRAELAKVEIFKAEMDGARLEATVQEQRVSVYRQRLEAINTIYRNYQTQVEAAKVKADVEERRLSAFKTRVEAQLDKVRGLVSIYEADTNRYNSEVRAGEATANTKIKQQELLSRNHEAALSLALENAKSNLQAFLNIAQMDIKATEGGAQIYTNMAATALNSLNAVIQLGSTATVASSE